MQYIEKVGRAIYSVSEFYRDINPSTLTGAIDIVVVEDEYGILSSSPFHVRFGKLKVLLPTEKIVTMAVNGRPVDIQMKVGDAGESFFVVEATGSEPIPAELATSPLAKPATILRKDIEVLDLNQRMPSLSAPVHHEYPLSDSEIETHVKKPSAYYDGALSDSELETVTGPTGALLSGMGAMSMNAVVTSPFSSSSSTGSSSMAVTKSDAFPAGHSTNINGNWSWGWGRLPVRQSASLESLDLSTTATQVEPMKKKKDVESVEAVSHPGPSSTAAFEHDLRKSVSNQELRSIEASPSLSSSLDLEPSSQSSPSEKLRIIDWLSSAQYVALIRDKLEAFKQKVLKDKQALFDSLLVLSQCAQFEIVPHLQNLKKVFSDHILPMEQFLLPCDPSSPWSFTAMTSSGSSSLVCFWHDIYWKWETVWRILMHRMTSGSLQFDLNRDDWSFLILNVLQSGSTADIKSALSITTSASTSPLSSSNSSAVATTLTTSATPTLTTTTLSSSSSSSSLPTPSLSPSSSSAGAGAIMGSGTNAGVTNSSGWRSWWSRAAPLSTLDKEKSEKEKSATELDKSLTENSDKSMSSSNLSTSTLGSHSPGFDSGSMSSSGMSEPATSPLSQKLNLSTGHLNDSSASLGGGQLARHYLKSLRLTHEQLLSLDLKPGCNTVSFTVGRASCSAKLYRWRHDSKIVISDIDGTITKSDVFGHLFTMVGKDWTHSGVAHLYSRIKANGYEILYLTSRAIGQADTTRYYLKGVEQGQWQLPDGPVIMSPDRLFTAFHREVIMRRPEDFKIACLRDILRLFNASSSSTIRRPFYAGFGNRTTDALSYKSVGIPTSRIFTINSYGDVSLELLSSYKSSYIALTDLVDVIFAPVHAAMKDEDYSDLNYWSTPQLSPLVQGKLIDSSALSTTKSNLSPKWSPSTGSPSTATSGPIPSSPLLLASAPLSEANEELLLKEPSSLLELQGSMAKRGHEGDGEQGQESNESSDDLEGEIDFSAMPWIQNAIQRPLPLLYQMRTEEQLEEDEEEEDDDDEEIDYPYI